MESTAGFLVHQMFTISGYPSKSSWFSLIFLRFPTPLKRSSNTQVEIVTAPETNNLPCELAEDPRWLSAQQVVASKHFSRSPLLSKFLLYVVKEAIEGRQNTITEHRIGVAVFGRPRSYRTDDDNIVRNYARQLRRRLTEHFTGEGCNEAVRIEVPVGTYVPSFHFVRQVETEQVPVSSSRSNLSTGVGKIQTAEPEALPSFGKRRLRSRFFVRFLIIAGIVAGISLASWILVSRLWMIYKSADPQNALWQSIFSPSEITFLVPPDAGLNLMEDLSHRTLPLAGYIGGAYNDLPGSSVDRHTSDDLHTQRYTDFASLEIVTALSHQANFDPRRVRLRFPRDLRFDDLKEGNAIIIGSASSNPWASIADSHSNFRIVPSEAMDGAVILNTHPQAGEQGTYKSHWNEPSHDTYGLILLKPNLSGSGHLLFIEGLDVAGTQAAADLIFHSDRIRPVLQRAKQKGGGLRPFEILVRSTSIQSTAAGTQVIATRID